MNIALKAKLKKIKMLATDVDGVLTDGSIIYGSNGEELKSFNIQDGLGIKMLQNSGIEVAIITGRVSPMVQRRADELGITQLIQGREDKATALAELADKNGLALQQIAYAGDDLPDLKAIRQAGVGFSISDASQRVTIFADYVTQNGGGRGAIREISELILQAQGLLNTQLDAFE